MLALATGPMPVILLGILFGIRYNRRVIDQVYSRIDQLRSRIDSGFTAFPQTLAIIKAT